MCFFLISLLLGPRAVIVLWWLVEPGRWDSAFDTFIIPLLGLIVLPWTTLAFVLVAPNGNVEDSEWFLLAIAFLVDIFVTGFGKLGRRARYGYR
jgi:hypothetical protein